MPAKHQYLQAGVDNSATPFQTAVPANSPAVAYTLTPLSPTSAHGLPLTEQIFCEINGVSANRLLVTVRSEKTVSNVS